MGPQGENGVQGQFGAQGQIGTQGNMGPQGENGVQGQFGTQGNDGFQGNVGSIGIQGQLGMQGGSGFQGNTGQQGLIGIQGDTGMQGNNGFQGNVGQNGVQGFQGPQGINGFTGPQGSLGFQGTGVAGPQGAISGVQGPQGQSIDTTTYVFGTDQSFGKMDFMGQGTSSSTFPRNSLILPGAGKLVALSFSIRNPAPNLGVQCLVWRQVGTGVGGIPLPTALTAFIPNGNTQICAMGVASVDVDPCDLISVQLDWSVGGALSDGATAAVTFARA